LQNRSTLQQREALRSARRNGDEVGGVRRNIRLRKIVQTEANDAAVGFEREVVPPAGGHSDGVRQQWRRSHGNKVRPCPVRSPIRHAAALQRGDSVRLRQQREPVSKAPSEAKANSRGSGMGWDEKTIESK